MNDIGLSTTCVPGWPMEGDDRFPYFSFLTEKDEKELSSQD